MPPEKPAIGYNIQLTKVTDRAGGPETITINTAVEPGASAEAIYGKIKVMGDALQKRIAQQCAAEERRQDLERQKAHALFPRGVATPEHPAELPHENGKAITDA